MRLSSRTATHTGRQQRLTLDCYHVWLKVLRASKRQSLYPMLLPCRGERCCTTSHLPMPAGKEAENKHSDKQRQIHALSSVSLLMLNKQWHVRQQCKVCTG